MTEKDDAFERQWRERFERYGAAHDDDASIAAWSASGLEARFRRFLGVWPGATAGQLWLDAGCGAGTYTRFLHEQGLRLIAVDYSIPSLKKAKQRAPEDIAWAAGDVTQLPLRGASIDGLLCFGVLQALGSPVPALNELHRVLKPGGTILIDALNGNCLPTFIGQLKRRWRKQPMHLRYDHPGRLVAAMREAGFRDVRCHWVPIVPSALKRFQPLLDSRLFGATARVFPWFGSLLSHAFLLSATASEAKR